MKPSFFNYIAPQVRVIVYSFSSVPLIIMVAGFINSQLFYYVDPDKSDKFFKIIIKSIFCLIAFLIISSTILILLKFINYKFINPFCIY